MSSQQNGQTQTIRRLQPSVLFDHFVFGLNRSKLHLNKSETALLVKHFSQALKPN